MTLPTSYYKCRLQDAVHDGMTCAPLALANVIHQSSLTRVLAHVAASTLPLLLARATAGDAAHQMEISFNISMLDLPCEFAAVDVLDVLGTNRANVTKSIDK
jgi:Endoplasmic Reticulum-Golgi Intermediate Compartment (ERGIC)